jgi:hypothetical protein
MSQSTESLVLQMMERLGALDDKWDTRWTSVQEKLQENTVELARLATTVEVHEKRSTTLEAMHNDCKRNCTADIADASAVAEKAASQVGQIRLGFKWAGAIIGGLITTVGVIATVLQLVKH